MRKIIKIHNMNLYNPTVSAIHFGKHKHSWGCKALDCCALTCDLFSFTALTGSVWFCYACRGFLLFAVILLEYQTVLARSKTRCLSWLWATAVLQNCCGSHNLWTSWCWYYQPCLGTLSFFFYNNSLHWVSAISVQCVFSLHFYRFKMSWY